MDGQGIDVSTEVSLKRMPITEHHNHSDCNISCSLDSENVNGEVPSLAPGISKCTEMLEIDTAQTTIQKASDLGCEGDNISCISKADGTNMEIGNHHGDTNQKNLTGSSASVTSFCQEGSEKPIYVQSTNHGCISDECIAEEGNTSRDSPELARETPQSAADLSDKSDPSETSSLRDEQGPVSPKVESVSPDRGTDMLQKCSSGFTDHCKSNDEIDSNGASPDVLNKLDQKQHSEMQMIHDMQKPLMQYRAIGDNEDSDELVDVRVCDICGDVGREALLAICSKCSDGAEHIYCMRIKMDKVPGSEWMCEDCTIVAEAQKQKAEEHKIGRVLQKSSTNEGVQNLRRLDFSGDDGRFKMGHASLASSRKRPGLNVEVNTSSKRRALDHEGKLSSPGSFLKAVSPRHSNLKIPLKDEVASPSGRNSLQNVSRKAYESLPGRSPKIESQHHKGSFSKQKHSNSAGVRTDQESEGVQRGQKTSKGSAAFGAGERHALTKLTKSKSFTTSSIVRMDRNDSKKSMENDFKIPKVGSKRSITQRSYSFNSKTSQSASPNVNSSISIVKPAKATPSSVEVKQRIVQNSHLVPKTADVRKEVERAAIHRVAKRQCDTNGSGFNRKMSSSLSNNGRSSGTSGRTGNVSLGQKADRSFANVENEQKLKDVKRDSNDMDKVQLNSTPSGATCNKLPICCSGLQAHLSTCASPKALEVARKLPSEITVKEVLQQDIWPVQFNENCVTENDIALYFFAEDHESYRRYKRFLNCMMLNDLALIAHLEGVELLIFHSQVLPARSRRWNNLFFLWGVFRAKQQSSYPDDVCVPSPPKGIQIPTSDTVTPPQNPPVPIPTISTPKNSSVSPKADQGISVAEVVSKSVPQSPISTKSNDNEVDIKTMEAALVENERHSEESQSTNEGQKEDISPDQAPEVKPLEEEITGVQHQTETASNHPSNNGHLSNIDVNVPVETNGFQGYDDDMNGRAISLNSSPSNSGGTGTSEKAMGHCRHDFNLELPLLAENEPVNEGDSGLVNGNANHANVEDDRFVSLDLSLALPSTVNDPVPMMEDPIPEMDDDVDTSLSLFFGSKKA
ncbi:hypothetical protein V2J09_004660 [Rumex salicifolius]